MTDRLTDEEIEALAAEIEGFCLPSKYDLAARALRQLMEERKRMAAALGEAEVSFQQIRIAILANKNPQGAAGVAEESGRRLSHLRSPAQEDAE